MTKINKPIVVFWFRRDLRLEDNAGLYHALQSEMPVLPLFIFDTEILSQLDDKQDRRVDLIHQVLCKMSQTLEQIGSTLIVKVGKPLEVFQQLTSEYEIKSVYTNRDYEPNALKRDKVIENYLKAKNIVFQTYKDQVIFEWNEVLKSNGEPYIIFTPYSKVWKANLGEDNCKSFNSENWVENFSKTDKQAIPDLTEIGFQKTDYLYSPPVLNENVVLTYEETRNLPAIEGTTGLSTHLRFGTISVRQLVAKAVTLNEQWLNELIWREFFMSILVHFPYIVNAAFKRKYDSIEWRNNETEFEYWCKGKTGYPIVDAGMRQLNETGWMHNRVRMIVASFLTKHLLIDWRWGEAYFASKLLDYDLSANNGNWQWAAGCGCDAAPYFRVFNPTEQTKKFDPELKYIRKWVKDFDSLAYPQPIVEHAFARNRALEVYKKGINDN
ncbi:MAG: deoxyribodipyrimidine photo-lyase [Paludibacter sp.]|nr:deoxyribodipyrimidine photo-lyase [Paludibacter sp.]